MLATKIEVSESDFETDLDNGDYLPILDFGEETSYYVTYGHIPFEEMVDYCNSYLEYIDEDLADYNLSEEDVTWRWAVALEPSAHDDTDLHFVLRWNEIGPNDEGSFPITLVSLW